MTEQQFIEICKAKYGLVSELDHIDDFYEREKRFAAIMQDLNRELLQKSISDTKTTDRRKKKRSAHLEK